MNFNDYCKQALRISQPTFQGSFPRSEFSFKVYEPATKTVEDSQIPDET